ncbi:MAG: CDP-alcohol phosphatidyltransferase family protein [Bacteroidales bacterium]|nr:CDP-alcohol phosphatidyltransferase family protein [Bacteroidales bacterium]
MNLLAGCMGVIFTLEGRPDAGFLMMLIAAAADFCDGLSARLLGAYSPVGKELDSLCDCVSFGVLPSLMLVQCMGTASAWRFLPLFLAVMSALRLAKFNIDPEQGEDFLGMPTPSSAIIAGSLAYLITVTPGSLFASLALTKWFLPLVALLLGLLTVSRVPMFGMKIAKGKKLLDAKRSVFLILAVLIAVLTAVLGLNWSAAVLMVFLTYLIENLILSIL